MIKAKIGLLTLVITVLIAVPVFANAQTAGGGDVVDQAQMQALGNLINQAQDLKKSGGDWQSVAAQAEQQCLVLNGELERITGTFGSKWKADTLDCYVGTITLSGGVQSGGLMARQSGGVKEIVYHEPFHLKVWGIASGGEPLTQTSYRAWEQKQMTTKDGEPEWWEKILNVIFVTLANIIASVIAGLGIMALYLMDTIIVNYVGQGMPEVVSIVWTIVRDFMNLMFIIALIAMAIATIIRYEAYSYKRILRDLIVMAILINFSMIIATTLISFSDTLIHLLKPTNGIKTYATTIYQGFVTHGDWSNFIGVNYGFIDGLKDSVSKIIALVVITVAFAAVALMMLVRLIGLYFLVMISPAAYAFNILPRTKHWAQQWWDTFFEYLIWGPVAMFFFRVGFVILEKSATGSFNFADVWLKNLFVAAFIYGGFLVAKNAGMRGGEVVTGVAQTAFSKAKSTAKFGASAAGNYVWRGNAAKHAFNVATMGTATDLGKKIGDTIGTTTARIENVPGNVKQKWVTKPNEERKKLVDRERRRTQIRKGYYNLDDDAAKKMSAEDAAYALQIGKGDEPFTRALINNGSRDVKFTVMKGFQEGLIKISDQAAYDQLYEDARKASLKAAGVKESSAHFKTLMKKRDGHEIKVKDRKALDQESQVLVDEIATVIDTSRRKKDYNDAADFASRTKNVYYNFKKPEVIVIKKRSKESAPITVEPSTAATAATQAPAPDSGNNTQKTS